ncbi:GNAT family N-acetyltransferase [Paenibacillus sp. GCM10012307]|uniref:GNAT family N-acetyltransferase n=1 Tax=Paenibacillus roseus TaxID=2798579 RepID=A0A934MSA5_9BACL|nr:GNAT family N-acetyltransferase [Paenibacillus roseus]
MIVAQPSAITIREAEEADKEAVLRVVLEAYQQYEQKLPEQSWEQYKESIRLSVREGNPKARLIAELDGEIIGSVQLFLSSEAAYGRADLHIDSPIIRFLSVSPQARGKGVATLLIKESARRSLELGASLLYLHTSDMMESAVKLYERLGFERAQDKEFYSGNTLVKSYKLQLLDHPLLKQVL